MNENTDRPVIMTNVYYGGKMIIWLDGTYCVGKSETAKEISKMLSDKKFDVIDSDEVYEDFSHKKMKFIEEHEELFKRYMIFLSFGMRPQTDKEFIEKFKKMILSKLTDENESLIIVMALPTEECRIGLYDSLIKKHNILHIILTASEDAIRERIKNDNNEKRDKELACDHLNENIRFYEKNYHDSIRVNTENKNTVEVAHEIIEIVSNKKDW